MFLFLICFYLLVLVLVCSRKRKRTHDKLNIVYWLRTSLNITRKSVRWTVLALPEVHKFNIEQKSGESKMKIYSIYHHRCLYTINRLFSECGNFFFQLRSFLKPSTYNFFGSYMYIYTISDRLCVLYGFGFLHDTLCDKRDKIKTKKKKLEPSCRLNKKFWSFFLALSLSPWKWSRVLCNFSIYCGS